jgi:hypothetical protein
MVRYDYLECIVSRSADHTLAGFRDLDKHLVNYKPYIAFEQLVE